MDVAGTVSGLPPWGVKAYGTGPQKSSTVQAGSGAHITLAVFRALMIVSKSSQLSLRKGGTSVMRYEPLHKAMIGALQDYLLSALPR